MCDFLESIADALASDDLTLPLAAPEEEAARYIFDAPDFDWPFFRRLIQSLRQRFLDWHDSAAGNACHSMDEVSSDDSDLPGATHFSGAVAPTGRRPCRPPVSCPPTPVSSLLDWGKTFLPDHFRKAPSEMHQWMAGELDRMTTDRGSKLNVLGPRGGAKSTVATLAYPLREALLGREPYIWILSDTMHQAHAHLENLKAELIDNELIARQYPRAAGRGPIWQAGRIVMRNGVTIEAFGTGQRIRGRRARANRPTLLVCDDLQNDRHMESVLQRGHARTWFQGTLLKAGTPRTSRTSPCKAVTCT